MPKILGIDLGTTNSAMAVMEGGDPAIIHNAEGSRITPSVVAFTGSGERLVGQTAKRQAIVNPENTVFSVKRLMGRRMDDAETENVQKHVPYALTPGPNNDVRVAIPATGKEHTPQEISAMILAKLKADAEAYLGEKISDAVITVPAYFNDSQRQATKDAGKIAGLNVLRIINEPTAAALAYGLDKKADEQILVFDLGGGTFDVSVLTVGDGVVEVQSTAGDTFLGGDDWDERVVGYLADEFKRDQGIDLRGDRQALQRLKEAAEKAKIELSSAVETEVNLPFITADATGPKHLQLKLSRGKFEQVTEDLVERLKGPFTQALKDAKIQAGDLDEVVLVGGSTRMPMVQELVRKLSGKEPHRGVNPDEVVALGAAIQGGVLGGDVRDVVLLDVTPLTLGVETLGGVMTAMIERNTTIPTRKCEIYSTAEDGQTAVDIKVLQGERPMARDNMLLGQFRLEGIPSAPRGMPQIEVCFDIDANGILNVMATDKATAREQKITITASTNLETADIERMVNEAKTHAAEDQKARALVEARNMADTLTYQTEKTLRELGDQVGAADRTRVEGLIGDLRTAMDGDDTDKIRQLTEELQQASHALSQQLHQSQAAADGPGTDGAGGDGAPQDEDVVEGEFREA